MTIKNYWQTRTDDELLNHYHNALERKLSLWRKMMRGTEAPAEYAILNNKCVRDIEAEMTSRISSRAAERAAGRASWPGQDGPEGADPGNGGAAAG